MGKPLPVVLASCVGMIGVSVAPLLVRLPANVPGKAAEDGASV